MLYVTGDTHRQIDINKLYTFIETNNVTKDDYLIITGDVGILWSSYTNNHPNEITKDDLNMIKTYQDFPFTTLFIDGNHDNHISLNSYPIEEWNGGKIHRLSDSVIHLMRGQVYTINGKKIFTLGGADSIDKAYRVVNESWWEDEMPSREEYEEAINNLEKVDFKVDYVFTHDCGSQFLSRLSIYSNKSDELEMFLWRLEKDFNLQFNHWYFGHHHVDMDLDETHTCLYDKIIKI